MNNLKPIQVDTKESKTFKGYTEEGAKDYNKYQLEGLELYKKCNFEKRLKRNINKHIEEYTKFFIYNNLIITVKPMNINKDYPSGYYEHCRTFSIYVDHDNKCLKLIEEV